MDDLCPTSLALIVLSWLKRSDIEESISMYRENDDTLMTMPVYFVLSRECLQACMHRDSPRKENLFLVFNDN